LAEHRHQTPFPNDEDWVFATQRGTPQSQRNTMKRGLRPAAERAGLNDGSWPPLRFLDELRARMAASPFAALLEPSPQAGGVVVPIAG
jgi:hypothetical protein